MLAIDEHLFEIDEAIDEVAKAFLALDDVQALSLIHISEPTRP